MQDQENVKMRKSVDGARFRNIVLPRDHPVVVHFEKDPSATMILVQVEDGTIVGYKRGHV